MAESLGLAKDMMASNDIFLEEQTIDDKAMSKGLEINPIANEARGTVRAKISLSP